MHVLVLPSELYITTNDPLSGIFQHHQAEMLTANGMTVGVVSSGWISPRQMFVDYPYVSGEIQEGVAVIRRYRQRHFPEKYQSVSNVFRQYVSLGAKAVAEYIRVYGRPDIVHAHNFQFAGAIAQKVLIDFQIPYIVTEHSSAFMRGHVRVAARPLIRSIANDAAVVSAVSGSLARTVEEWLEISKGSLMVLPNIIAKRFQQPVSVNLKKDSKKFRIITVGSLDDNKNHRLLIESFQRVFGSKSAELSIVGSGPLDSSLRALVHELGVKNQVRFLGRLKPEDVLSEMDGSDCFVLSSRIETFGVSLIEAISRGLPVIATRCGGPDEIVTSENGILVEVDSQNELSAALDRMSKTYSGYNRQYLHDGVVARFGWEASFARFRNVYLEVVKR